MSSRKKIQLAAFVLLAFVVLLLVVHVHYRLAVRSYKAELKTKGEVLTVAEAAPKPLPPQDNGAPLFLQAVMPVRTAPILSQNAPRAMRGLTNGHAVIGWAQPDLRTANNLSNSWAELGAELDAIAPQLEQVREALQYSSFSYNLNYQQGFTLMLPQLAKVKGAAQKFSGATLYQLHEKKLDSALVNLRALVALAKVERDERLMISQLVRIAIAHLAFNAAWEALQAPGWTDAQLAQLQADWETIEFINAMENSLVMERAMGEETLEQCRSSGAELDKMLDMFSAAFALMAPAPASSGSVEDLLKGSAGWISRNSQGLIWRAFWSYEDELRYLQMGQIVIEGARMAKTNHSSYAVQAQVDAGFKPFERNHPADEEETFGLNFMPGNGTNIRNLF